MDSEVRFATGLRLVRLSLPPAVPVITKDLNYSLLAFAVHEVGDQPSDDQIAATVINPFAREPGLQHSIDIRFKFIGPDVKPGEHLPNKVAVFPKATKPLGSLLPHTATNEAIAMFLSSNRVLKVKPG